MSSGLRCVALLFACLAVTGCAANDLLVKRQSETDAKVEHLIQTGKKGEQRMNEFAARLQEKEEQSKASQQQVAQLQDTIKELRAGLDELKARVALFSQQAATPKVEVINPEQASKVTRDGGPPADYLKAFGLYSANNFPGAIESFELFLKNNPQSEYAANALYWIGECYYSLSTLPKAKEYFFKVAGSYPNSSKAPDSLLKLGYTLTAMGEKDKALAIFDSLIKTYPSSGAALKARERLSSQ